MSADPRIYSYLRRGHKCVEGWLEPGATEMIVSVDRLQRKLGVTGNVAEIGVHHGRLLILLYLLTRWDERALAIDLFSEQHLNIDHSGKGDLASFLANMRRHADVERLVIHEGNSLNLTAPKMIALAGGRFRLISIDGGHTCEITMHDLATAETSLADGGVIILDDLFSGFFAEVAEGTFRYFLEKPRSIVPFAIGANKTMFCGRQWAEQYLQAVFALSPKTAWRDFLASRVLCLDFTPPSFEERIGDTGMWRAIRDLSAIKSLRRAYKNTFRAR